MLTRRLLMPTTVVHALRTARAGYTVAATPTPVATAAGGGDLLGELARKATPTTSADDCSLENQYEFDLAVIGSGPTGRTAACLAASQFKKKVALIDVKDMTGGVCVHTGTIPSKVMRESLLHLSGFAHKGFYGSDYIVRRITMKDLTARVHKVINKEVSWVNHLVQTSDVNYINGLATFVDPHTLKIVSKDAKDGERLITARNILIACGTRPAHDKNIPMDGDLVFDADQFLNLTNVPNELIVVGAGVIGMEYASMMGCSARCKVTVIDSRDSILDFVDRDIMDDLLYHMRKDNTTFLTGVRVEQVRTVPSQRRVIVRLTGGKIVSGDGLLYAVGRQANSDRLEIKNAGAEMKVDVRGKIKVNAEYRTNVPHIFAGGDVIGFPALASSAMDQGRIIANAMFNPQFRRDECNKYDDLLPYGIYTIPEISVVGKTEQDLVKNKIPYEVGICKYSDISKGHMLGDNVGGMLKLLVNPRTLELLGVHCIGMSATELVHIGQMVMSLKGTIKEFTSNVFNYPTLSQCYREAAQDALNKLEFWREDSNHIPPGTKL